MIVTRDIRDIVSRRFSKSISLNKKKSIFFKLWLINIWEYFSGLDILKPYLKID